MIYDYLVDTDVMIWYFRGNENAREMLHKIDFAISCVTYMELLQDMRNKHELKQFQKMITSWNIKVVYIDEEISAKATHYMEEYFLSHSLELADSLIGATCTKHGLTLVAANDKHYKFLNDLDILVFRP
ncbi:type II toxin-antitoxin system VapC family toxin [Nitrosophilus labii]|uniref:type II toxin-antitoxin system VapC family toxin n=1 Tax=Nitrosophilus labii TaxID=2706014 RepID=UPI0016572E65|nr:type II toxin-antitoxin system VapC family toxin [Nitrosophilus labii]